MNRGTCKHLGGWCALALLALYFLAFYLVRPLAEYPRFRLLAFDFGILFQSTSLLAERILPFVTLRGLHVWADNQDYFQWILSFVHALPNPYVALITLHSLAIFSCGVFVFITLRGHLMSAVALASFTLLHPALVNMNNDLVHTEAFATIALLLLCATIRFGRTIWFYFFSIMALSCKEDVAITFVTLVVVSSFLNSPHRKLAQKHLLIAASFGICIFLLNLTVVLPYYKLLTCLELDSEFHSTASLTSSFQPTSPWFSRYFSQPFSLEVIGNVFFRSDVAVYLAKLFWPLLFVNRIAWPFALAALPGVIVNILSGSDELIALRFHYDHSTFAMILLACIVGVLHSAKPALHALALVIPTLFFHVVDSGPWRGEDDLPYFVTSSIFEPLTRDYWEAEKRPQVETLEYLNSVLPRNIVISADYTSVNYLLRSRKDVFMMENPFHPESFGVYGRCETFAEAIRPDLVIVHREKQISLAVQRELSATYEQHFLPEAGFLVYIRRTSAQFKNLTFFIKLAAQKRGQKRGQLPANQSPDGGSPTPSDKPIQLK